MSDPYIRRRDRVKSTLSGKSGKVVGFAANGSLIKVLFDGDSEPKPVSPDTIVKVPQS